MARVRAGHSGVSRGNPRVCPLYNPRLLLILEGVLSIPHGTTANGHATPERTALESELAALLVEVLNLDVVAEQIDPQVSLFNEGLGLDSIDVLELALEVSQRYGFQLRADDENNHAIFQSLRTLAAHVALQRTK
jgi:acyl carrier protein